jgi:hypothetical protein
MAFLTKDRVRETTTTTGTSSILLAGAVTGYQAFSTLGDGTTTYYCVAGTSEWEVGIGTYAVATNTLARTAVLASSNSGSLVSFSTGTKDVFVTYPAGVPASYIDSPNATVNVSSVNGFGATASVDLALVPKGSGAILGQVPTGDISGGNKRGQYAVDWQLTRLYAVEVASGLKSVIAGGHSNKATNDYTSVGGGTTNYATGYISTIAGGLGNVASGSYGAIGGGGGNLASNDGSTVAGGDSNQSTGIQSTVAGGSQNDATNNYAAVVGGRQNAASGDYSIVGGGNVNAATGSYSFVGGGYLNNTTNNYAFVGGGSGNNASGANSTIAGGASNTASGQWSTVIGGSLNTANAQASTVVGGRYGTTRGITGLICLPACSAPIASAAGVSQAGLLILGVQTTNATPTVLRSNSAAATTSNQLILSNNSAVLVTINMLAWDQTSWYTVTRQGVITRGASAATVVYTDVGSSTSSRSLDGGAATWAISQAADTTNGGLAVTVTGQAGKTIRWVCKLETTEVAY